MLLLWILAQVLLLVFFSNAHRPRCFSKSCESDGVKGCKTYETKLQLETHQCCDANNNYHGYFPNLTRIGNGCYQCYSCEMIRITVDGDWSNWSEWSTCSSDCNTGVMSRKRECNNPPPSGLGKPCSGEEKQDKNCNTHPCPIDGGWSDWSDWTYCTVSCGGGNKRRYRSCDNPFPEHKGKDCIGKDEENLVCNKNPCPVDGGWTGWSRWGPCNVTCGCGTKKQTRSCTNPRPAHGGKPCDGKGIAVDRCCLDPCPIHGGWSPWSEWGDCISHDCQHNLRYQTRMRACANPSPAYGGRMCKGRFFSTQSCDEDVNCPRDGGWSPWSPYHCTVTGASRTRNCTHPSPRFGGKTCSPPDYQGLPKSNPEYKKICSNRPKQQTAVQPTTDDISTQDPGSGSGSGDFDDQEAGDDL